MYKNFESSVFRFAFLCLRLFASKVWKIEDVLLIYACSSAIGWRKAKEDEIIGKRSGRGTRPSSGVSADPCDENFQIALIWSDAYAVTVIDAAAIRDARRVWASRGLVSSVLALTLTASINPR